MLFLQLLETQKLEDHIHLSFCEGWITKKVPSENVQCWHSVAANPCYFNKCLINAICRILSQVSWGACHKQHKALGAGVCLQTGVERLPEPKGIWWRGQPFWAASTAPTNGGLDQPLQNEAGLCHTHGPKLWRPPERGDPNNFRICGPGHAPFQFIRRVQQGLGPSILLSSSS